jgi:hypothetical protein
MMEAVHAVNGTAPPLRAREKLVYRKKAGLVRARLKVLAT